MIEHVSLENFKALREIRLNLGMITVLIGKNATGKSSVLQALAVLKQSRGAPGLMPTGPHVSLGEYQDIVHKKEETREIRFKLTNLTEEPIEPLFRGESRYVYEATFDSKSLLSQRGKIELEGITQFEGSYMSRPRAELKAQPNKFEYGNISLTIKGNSVIAVPLRTTGGSLPSEDDEAKKQYEQSERCLGKLFSAIDDALANTYYVPAIRGFSEPYYPLGDGPIQDLSSVGPRGSQAQHVSSTLAYRRDLESKVSDWTERITRTNVEARIIPQKRVTVEAIVGSRKMNIVNEGFGTNQLIQPLLQLAIAPVGSLILIEEPEIHIHPEAQSRLCEVLIKTAKAERKQILITTHSEHILTTFLTCVANRELKAKELAVYFFEKARDEATVLNLPVDHRGQIRGGLKGFFEASMDELEVYMKALSKDK